MVGKSDWFGPGSRVIVTTQNRHLLAFHGIDRVYQVQPLNDNDAYDFLKNQIFKEGNADPSFRKVLNELISHASGLPLALKVIGSHLHAQTVENWTTMLHRFKRIPPLEIMNMGIMSPELAELPEASLSSSLYILVDHCFFFLLTLRENEN